MTIAWKENRTSVLIACKCGIARWVKKGSPCHTKGKCDICIQDEIVGTGGREKLYFKREPTPDLQRHAPRINRNDPCPCGKTHGVIVPGSANPKFGGPDPSETVENVPNKYKHCCLPGVLKVLQGQISQVAAKIFDKDKVYLTKRTKRDYDEIAAKI